jgi:hypothetical protein
MKMSRDWPVMGIYNSPNSDALLPDRRKTAHNPVEPGQGILNAIQVCSSAVCNGVNDRWTRGPDARPGSLVVALNQLVLGGSGSSRDLQRQSDAPHLRE